MRTAEICRKTAETDIARNLNPDGSGRHLRKAAAIDAVFADEIPSTKGVL